MRRKKQKNKNKKKNKTKQNKSISELSSHHIDKERSFRSAKVSPLVLCNPKFGKIRKKHIHLFGPDQSCILHTLDFKKSIS